MFVQKKVISVLFGLCAGIVLFVLAGASCQSQSVIAENQERTQEGDVRSLAQAKPGAVALAPQADSASQQKNVPAASNSQSQDPRLVFGQKLQQTLIGGTVKDALALFENSPQDYAQNPQMKLLYASLLLSDNQLEKAQKITAELVAAEPKNVDALMLSALVAKAAGDTIKKQTTIKQVIALDPTNSDANVELANEQMLRKNYPLARRYYSTALQGDSKNTNAIFGLGQSSYYLGDFTVSENAFNTMLKNDPTDSLAWAYLGKLEAEKSNFSKAIEYIETAIKHNGAYDYWLDYGQYLRAVGRFADAAKAWERAAVIDPNYFLAFAYLAGLYDEMENFDASLKNYRLVAKTNPDYYFAYEAIGMLAWRTESWAESRDAFAKSREKNESNISYPLLIAATYLKEGNKTEAKNYLDKVMRRLDRNSLEYAMTRLFFDGYGDAQVAAKVRSEQNSTTRGKMTFYLALFYDLNNASEMAQQYYLEVQNFNAPMFFEYRLNDWAVAKFNLAAIRANPR
jgi:tetratricopeptide (TPR) repeat protein